MPDDIDPNDVDPLDDVDPADDVDPKDDDGKDKPDAWKAPTTKAEFDRMVAEQGNAEAAKWRRRATGKDPKWTPGGAPPKTDPPKTTKDDDGKDKPVDEAAIRAAVRAEVEGEYKVKADQNSLRGEVSLALMGAGLNLSDEVAASPTETRKAVAKIVNLMDIDNMVLEDGKVEGLDDEIRDLKKNYPGLFKATARKPVTKGGDVAPKGGGGKPAGGDDAELAEVAKAFFGGSSA